MRLLAALALAVALGACQHDQPGARPASGAAAPLVATAATTQTAAQPPAEPARPDEDPGQLIGLEPDAVAALLGAPDLVRREKPAEIWQYGAADCVFDVFLYEERGASRVVYLEARDRRAEPSETRGCFNAVLGARRDGPVS